MRYLFYLLFVLPLIFSCGNSEAIDVIEQEEKEALEKELKEKEEQKKRKEEYEKMLRERSSDDSAYGSTGYMP
jgi:hypothetical protein